MDAKIYQELAARTLVDEPGFEITDEEVMLSWSALGLCGEAGEVADILKKGVYHQHGLDIAAIKKELGDVLWYVSALCTTLNIQLSEVMQLNVDKLKSRYPDGFNSAASINRKD